MASGRTLDQVAASLQPSPVGAATSGAGGSDIVSSLDPERPTLRPKLIWFNFGLTVALLALLGLDVLSLALVFVGATAIALVVNFPKQEDQLTAIKSHATSIVSVVAMVFAAAVLVGVLSGTGMVTAMAHGIVAGARAARPLVRRDRRPAQHAAHIPSTNDAIYFGILPILTEAAGHYGIAPVGMARASIVGQPVHMTSPLVPALLLLVSLARVNLADHAAICLWRLVNRFQARRRRPAPRSTSGLPTLSWSWPASWPSMPRTCPSPSLSWPAPKAGRSSPSRKAGPGRTTATSAPRRHLATADRGELAVGSRLWCRRRPRPGIWTTALSHRTDWRISWKPRTTAL
jgi:hypothetical protein